jgi:hypothetical protein
MASIFNGKCDVVTSQQKVRFLLIVRGQVWEIDSKVVLRADESKSMCSRFVKVLYPTDVRIQFVLPYTTSSRKSPMKIIKFNNAFNIIVTDDQFNMTHLRKHASKITLEKPISKVISGIPYLAISAVLLLAAASFAAFKNRSSSPFRKRLPLITKHDSFLTLTQMAPLKSQKEMIDKLKKTPEIDRWIDQQKLEDLKKWFGWRTDELPKTIPAALIAIFADNADRIHKMCEFTWTDCKSLPTISDKSLCGNKNDRGVYKVTKMKDFKCTRTQEQAYVVLLPNLETLEKQIYEKTMSATVQLETRIDGLPISKDPACKSKIHGFACMTIYDTFYRKVTAPFFNALEHTKLKDKVKNGCFEAADDLSLDTDSIQVAWVQNANFLMIQKNSHYSPIPGLDYPHPTSRNHIVCSWGIPVNDIPDKMVTLTNKSDFAKSTRSIMCANYESVFRVALQEGTNSLILTPIGEGDAGLPHGYALDIWNDLYKKYKNEPIHIHIFTTEESLHSSIVTLSIRDTIKFIYKHMTTDFKNDRLKNNTIYLRDKDVVISAQLSVQYFDNNLTKLKYNQRGIERFKDRLHKNFSQFVEDASKAIEDAIEEIKHVNLQRQAFTKQHLIMLYHFLKQKQDHDAPLSLKDYRIVFHDYTHATFIQMSESLEATEVRWNGDLIDPLFNFDHKFTSELYSLIKDLFNQKLSYAGNSITVHREHLRLNPEDNLHDLSNIDFDDNIKVHFFDDEWQASTGTFQEYLFLLYDNLFDNLPSRKFEITDSTLSIRKKDKGILSELAMTINKISALKHLVKTVEFMKYNYFELLDKLKDKQNFDFDVIHEVAKNMDADMWTFELDALTEKQYDKFKDTTQFSDMWPYEQGRHKKWNENLAPILQKIIIAHCTEKYELKAFAAYHLAKYIDYNTVTKERFYDIQDPDNYEYHIKAIQPHADTEDKVQLIKEWLLSDENNVWNFLDIATGQYDLFTGKTIRIVNSPDDQFHRRTYVNQLEIPADIPNDEFIAALEEFIKNQSSLS